jgi:murein DD-endopeptidase MepM/ murein hydrolase activator NlpD
MPDLPDVPQQSWTNFSADRWFNQTSQRINSLSQPPPGNLFLESSNNLIGSLGGLGGTMPIPQPAPFPAPPRPQPIPQPSPQPIPQPTLPEPTPAPAPMQPTLPAQPQAPAPSTTPPPFAPPAPPVPVAPSLPTPPPTLPPRPIQTVPDVPDVPTLGGTTVLPKPSSIYTPVAATAPTQGPFGGTPNGPFASDTTTPTTPSSVTITSPKSAGPSGSIPASINVPINQGPSISRAQTVAALQGTPLQDIAGQIWDLGVKYNVDPAFALSVAKNESAYGDPTVAPGQAKNNNIWDISNAAYGGTPNGTRWGQYPDKLTGAEAFYKLITTEYYPKGQDTIGSVMWGPNGSQTHAYAPLSENSADYPTRLLNTMTGYGTLPGADQSSTPAPVTQQAQPQTQPQNQPTTVFPLPDFKGPVQDHWGSVLGGSDLFAPRGTPVSVMTGGKVVESGYNSIGGNSVLIQGDDGLQYYYAHGDATPSVKVGDRVSPGQFLMPVGDTGDAKGTGTHLHLGIGPDIKLGADKYGGTGGDYDAVGLLQRTLDNSKKAPAATVSPAQSQPSTQITQTSDDPIANLDAIKTQAANIFSPQPKIPSQQMTQFTPQQDELAPSSTPTQSQRSYLDLFKNDQQDIGGIITSAVQRAISGITGGLMPPGGPPGGGDRGNQRRDEDQQTQNQFNPDTGDVGNLDLRNLSSDMIDRLFENPVTHEPGAIQQATGLYTSPPKTLEEAANRALADIQRRGIPFPGPGGSISFLQPGRSLRELNPLSKGPDAGALEDILGAVPGILGGGGHTSEDLVNPLRTAAAEAATGRTGAVSKLTQAGRELLDGIRANPDNPDLDIPISTLPQEIRQEIQDIGSAHGIYVNPSQTLNDLGKSLETIDRLSGGGEPIATEAARTATTTGGTPPPSPPTSSTAGDVFDEAAATGSSTTTASNPTGAGLQRNGLQSIWDSVVRNWFDQNTDLGNVQKDLARRVGPLSDDQRVADLTRLDPTHQAESVLEEMLSPSLTKMSQQELDEFDKFVELHTDRSANEGLAKIAERQALEGGIADSTTRRLDEANAELSRVQQEHAQALADQRAIDAGSGYRTRQSIGLDAAGQRVRDAQDALDEAHVNARDAAAAKAHADTLFGSKGELVRVPEIKDLAVAESDAKRANAAYNRLAARDESIPIAPKGQSNAVRAQYERRLASMGRQVGYAEDRVSRIRTALGENVVSRETNVNQAAEAAAAKARQTLSQEAQDLLKKVADGGVPTRMTSNLRRIADEHGIPVTSDTTPNDVIKALQKIRRNPPATPELAAAQVRLRYEQANLDRLQKAKSEGQRILDETLARAFQKVNKAQRDVDVANADLPKYAEAQGWAQLHGRVSRDPYTGDAIHYDDVIQRLKEMEDRYRGTPTWDKFTEGYRALHNVRVRQLNERVDAGILTPEARDALLDTYDFHTPTNMVDYVSDERPNVGALGRGSSFSVRNNGLQRYTPEGSSLEHESHLGATIREVYNHYNAIGRNRRTNAFINADNGGLRRIADNVDEYVSAGGKNGPLLEPDYKLKGNEQPVVAMVNGKRKEYVTSNPLLKEAIRNNSLGTDNKWINYMKLPAKLVRETAIQRNPKFLPVNMLRDTASTVLKEMAFGGPTVGGKNPATGRFEWDFRPTRGLGSTALNLGPAALTAAMTDPNDPDRGKKVAAALALGMGTRAGLNTNLGMGSSATRRFITVFLDNMAGLGTGRMTGQGVRALSEAGGRVGQSDLFRGGGPEATAEALRKLSRPNAFTVRNLGDLRQLADDAAFGFVKSFGQRLENIPRQVSFEQAKARGESNVQAALRAKDASVDFDRGGRIARVLNQFVPFFNVGFQAPAQLKRLVEENPLGALYAGMTLLGAPAAAAEAWNRSDPQRAKDYEDDPNYLTNQGIDIMLPGDQPQDAQGNRTPQKIHLAIPNEFMPFVTAGREAYNRLAGGPVSSASDLAGALGQELSPLGYGTSVSSVAQALLPPGIDTALQLGLNHDLFRGATIANQYSDASASNLGKTLAPLLEQYVTQIPGHETDRIRPSQVDFVIKDVLNGLGQQGLEATDALSGRQPQPGDAGNIPLVGGLAGRFVRTTGGQSWEDVRQPQQMLSNDLRQKLRSYGDYYEPSTVPSDIQKIPLRREEQVEYQRLTNQYFNQYLDQYSGSSNFGNTAIRKQMISDAMDRARAMAESQVLRQIRQNGSSLNDRLRNNSAAY